MPEGPNPELWKRVDEVLDGALELPSAERAAFVATACAGDPKLRDEVMSLLLAEQQAGSFMTGSAMGVAARALAEENHRVDNPISVGDEIGKYRIERLLGAGGMGEVYLAHEANLNRKVALKILPAKFVLDPERVARFEREARVISALNHPNLITIYEIGSTADLHFIAMEFVEGKTLSELSHETLKLRDLLLIIAQAAEALIAAHQAGIVHRDIKPDNIMVRADGYVKVLDFGLAKLTEFEQEGSDQDQAQTQAGAVLGTLVYMSPEQATGEALDHRTDIWSLGVVLYELVTGAAPFKQEMRVETVKAILQSDPDSVRDSNPSLPAELDHIIEKALEKNRELRYQTASDFRADLRRLLRSMDSSPSRQSESIVLPGRRAARRWLWPVAACAVVLSVIMLAGWRVLKARPGGPDWSRATHLQLTDQVGTECFPTLSPDGKSFVYASNSNGNFDLFSLRVGGKNPQNLTKDSSADDTQPAFSPDGDHIAFRSERNSGGIYVMEATGENVRRIADRGFHPSWSPDGKEIVFSESGRDLPSVRNNRLSALWIVNLPSGGQRLLVKDDAMQPAWSPGGERIAYWYMRPSAGRSDIATIPAAGGAPVIVTKDGTTNWNPAWSPDGKFLYYVSDRSGNMNFWRVAIDEKTGQVLSESEAVTTPSKFSRHLGFSRNGKRMIYVQTEEQSNIQGSEIDLKTEKLTGEPFWITRGDRMVSRPELSSDGKQFVMRLPRRTQDDIVVVNRDGTNWRDLTNDKPFDRYPRWSPDGRKVAFTSDRTGKYEIWTVDADGTNLRQISFTSTEISFPVWSPDGQKLSCRIDLKPYILDMTKEWHAQTPQPLPAPEAADRFVVWDWSPDGQKLAGTFEGRGEGIGYFSLETNRFERVSDMNAQPMWLPDSRRFVFTHDGKAFIADTVTKKVRELFAKTPDQVRALAVSRDGRLIYYTVHSSESDVWLLNLE